MKLLLVISIAFFTSLTWSQGIELTIDPGAMEVEKTEVCRTEKGIKVCQENSGKITVSGVEGCEGTCTLSEDGKGFYDSQGSYLSLSGPEVFIIGTVISIGWIVFTEVLAGLLSSDEQIERIEKSKRIKNTNPEGFAPYCTFSGICP